MIKLFKPEDFSAQIILGENNGSIEGTITDKLPYQIANELLNKWLNENSKTVYAVGDIGPTWSYLTGDKDTHQAQIILIEPIKSESKVEITKSEFYKAVSDVMKEDAIKNDHKFIGPHGPVDTPYNIDGFDGWSELAERLGFK